MRNLFSLLKEVDIDGMRSKLIYMTNRQVRQLNLDNMSWPWTWTRSRSS